MSKTLFQSGDPVPRSWFKTLDNVESVTFAHPCLVEETETMRTIMKAGPFLQGHPILLFKHFEGSDGVMNVGFDRETIIVWSEHHD
jgi:hypothetical protein